MIIDITEENFEREVLKSDVPVVIDIHADWCGPCKQMRPVFESVAEKLGDRVKCGRIDTGTEKRLRIAFCVASLPTVSVVRGNTFIDVADGLMPADEIVSRVEQVLTGELDAQLARKLMLV